MSNLTPAFLYFWSNWLECFTLSYRNPSLSIELLKRYLKTFLFAQYYNTTLQRIRTLETFNASAI